MAASRHLTVTRRPKRVQIACGRCRMKKTKCDEELPCRRCKNDGTICTARIRNKVECKRAPLGYAEILEKSQTALIATVHKLYSMVRAKESWELGEPEANDCGLPIIHSIANKLGCIRPHDDGGLPDRSQFPEDKAGMADLTCRLERQRKAHEHWDPHNMDSIFPTYLDGTEAGASADATSDITMHVTLSALGSSPEPGISGTSGLWAPSVASPYACPRDVSSPGYLLSQPLQGQRDRHVVERRLEQGLLEPEFGIFESDTLCWNDDPAAASPAYHCSHGQHSYVRSWELPRHASHGPATTYNYVASLGDFETSSASRLY